MKSKKGLTITILFVSMLQMGGMGLAPSLASIAADMPEVPVSIDSDTDIIFLLL